MCTPNTFALQRLGGVLSGSRRRGLARLQDISCAAILQPAAPPEQNKILARSARVSNAAPRSASGRRRKAPRKPITLGNKPSIGRSERAKHDAGAAACWRAGRCHTAKVEVTVVWLALPTCIIQHERIFYSLAHCSSSSAHRVTQNAQTISGYLTC